MEQTQTLMILGRNDFDNISVVVEILLTLHVEFVVKQTNEV
jgi:hypothetical protein